MRARFWLAILLILAPFWALAQNVGPGGPGTGTGPGGGGGGGGAGCTTNCTFAGTTTTPVLHATSATISGGTVNGATIGGTTPAAGTFTTLSAPLFNAWGPQFTASHLSDGAPAGGGSGYAVGDVVTLSSGTKVSVTIVSGGAITQFLVNTPATASAIPVQPETQTSTTGSGTGATFNIAYEVGKVAPSGAPLGTSGVAILGGYHSGWGIIGSSLGPTCGGYVSCGAGLNDDIGTGGGTGLTGPESTMLGYATGAQVTTGRWITATGHNACGHEVDGVMLDCYGVDAFKYGLHNNNSGAFGVDSGKFIWNTVNFVALGTNTGAGTFINPTVSAVANNGSGAVRLTVSATTGLTTGDAVWVHGLVGGPAVNTAGTPWFISVIDGTHIDLQGSTFAAGYVSGGVVTDLPGGFSNIAVTGAQTNGGAVQLLVANTINLNTTDTIHVMGVGGTVEANGDWPFTVQDQSCTSGNCKITLTGSTFVNAWTSGGHVTDMRGPTNFTALGAQTLASAALTGNNLNVTVVGSGAAPAAKQLLNTTVICPACASTNLGSTGQNSNIVLISGNATADVASPTTVSSVGIGTDFKLGTLSVQIGNRAGFFNSITSAASRIVLVGEEAGFAMQGPVQTSALGYQVGHTVCQSPTNVLLLGTSGSTDCASATETGAIHIGAGSTDVITATSTATPAASITTMAGWLKSGGGSVFWGDGNHTPVIGSGFGTGAAISAGTNAGWFRVNVGTGGAASTGNIALSTITNGWSCYATDITNPAASNTVAVSINTSSISLTNYSRTTGVATAWAASDIIQISCNGG